MPTELFEKHPTSLRLEMFTVKNEGFQRWDPAPKSAEAKAFLVITAEDLADGAFTTQVVGLSLNGLKDMGKNGIQHVAKPTEKQRAIVNGCIENASRAIGLVVATPPLFPEAFGGCLGPLLRDRDPQSPS